MSRVYTCMSDFGLTTIGFPKVGVKQFGVMSVMRGTVFMVYLLNISLVRILQKSTFISISLYIYHVINNNKIADTIRYTV